jgi:hypothetical protein
MTNQAGVTHDILFSTFAGTEYGFMLSENPDIEGTKMFQISEASSFADKISEGEASYVQTNPETDLVWNQDDWTGGCGLEKIIGNETNRFWDSTNCDTRWPHSIMLAPRMNYFTYSSVATAIDCGSAATNRGTVVTSGTGDPTTIQVQVSAADEDAVYDYSGSGTFASHFSNALWVKANTTEADRDDSGLVFTSVSVPQGATITAATLEVYVYSTDTDDVNCNIYGNDVNSANDFTDEANIISRTKTTAYTLWSSGYMGTGWVTSPDIKSVVQEITDRASWATGNNMCFLLCGGSSGTQNLRFYAYEYGASYAAKLNITYTTSGTLRTYLDLNNAANASGTINQVQIYANTALSGVKVGTFTGSGVSWAVHDSETIGDVSAGSVQTFDVELTTTAADVLGIYFAGSLEADSTGSLGVLYYAGDGTVAGAKTYTSYDASAQISLYGTGETASGSSTAMGTVRGPQAFTTFGGKVYCVCAGPSDTYVFRLDTNVWSKVLTDTDALNPRGMICYGNGTANYIIAYMDSKYYHSTTGADSSWTAVTKDVEFMLPIKGVLWAANGATVFSCTDPTNVNDWISATTIGDNNFSITHLYERDGILYVAKPDGLWSFDANSNDENLTPEFRFVAANENFKYGCITKNLGIFSTFYDGVMLYDGTNLTDIAPGIDSTSLTVSGASLVGICNGVDWVYAVYRVLSGDSDTIQVVAGRLQYEDGNLRWAWHPLWYGVTYSNPNSEYHDGMLVAGSAETSYFDIANPNLFMSQSNYRLDAGGGVYTTNSYTPGHFILPKGHLAPNNDTNCRFVYTETGASTHPGLGYVYTPSWDGGFPDQDKAFIYFALQTEGCYASGGTDYTYVTISYKIDEATAWTSLTTVTSNGVPRVDFPAGTYGKKIKFRYTLGNVRGYYYTPIIKSTTLHSVLKTRRRRRFDMLIKLADNLTLLDQAPSDKTAVTWKEDLYAIRDQIYPLTIYCPDYFLDDSYNYYTVQITTPITITRTPDTGTNPQWVAHVIAEEVLKS